MPLFEGAPFKFRAPFGARTFSPLWTDLLQSFTPSVACIPAGKRRSTRRKIFAKSLAQSYLVLSDKLVCFNQKLYGLVAKWFPGVLPLHGTSARSPLTTAQSALVEERGHSTRALPCRAGSAVPRDIFCSAPPLGCGSVHVLDGSFARFCVSENVRVPLRYSGQPLHRKIIASRSPNTPWFCLSNRFFVNSNQAIDYKSIYADSWDPKITLRINRARLLANCAPISISLFSVLPRGGSKVAKSVWCAFCGSIRSRRFRWYMSKFLSG